MPSLGYKITDRHLLRGFITFRKSFTAILCDYIHYDRINYTNYLDDCSVLACEHDYYNHCLQKYQSKCLICLDYLQIEIKKNVNTLRESMTKKLNENEFINENDENIVDNDSGNIEAAMDDVITIENLLKYAKKAFFEL